MSERVIWLNGEIVPVSEAKIPVLSPTAQFGLNVFEGVPCYWNDERQKLYAFRLEDHLIRLERSARLLQIDFPYTYEEITNSFKEVIQANRYKEDLSVRITLFVDGLGSWGSSDPVGMFIAPIPKRQTSAEYHKEGLRCCVSTWRRISEIMLSPHIKCGANYINSRMAQREALRNGYDTAIFLNEFGKVAEGPGSCLFIVIDEGLVTPQITDGVLDSITRRTIIEIAKDNGIPCYSRTIDRTELYSAKEAFLCGSAMGVTPVLSIDDYLFNNSDSILTKSVWEFYYKMVTGKADNYLKYCTCVS